MVIVGDDESEEWVCKYLCGLGFFVVEKRKV